MDFLTVRRGLPFDLVNALSRLVEGTLKWGQSRLIWADFCKAKERYRAIRFRAWSNAAEGNGLQKFKEYQEANAKLDSEPTAVDFRDIVGPEKCRL